MVNWKVHQNLQGTKFKSFSFSKILGSGSFAVVYQASDSRNGNLVAIKVLPLKQLKANYKLDELVQTQIRVLKQISKSKNKNQNVVAYIDHFVSDRSLLIVMDYCNGGDLSQYLNKKKRLTEDEATDMLKQILNGFRGLHEANAMHRDFKAANVLLHQGICKIADLGFAKQLFDQKSMTTTILGTDLTKAPQVLELKSYGMQTDIWSVGVVYYQLIYGDYPYEGFSEGQILQKIKAGPPNFKSVNISPQAFDFITRCLTIDPKKRIKWNQIYEHPLINNVNRAIYGLNSAVLVSDNKNFYKQGIQVPANFLDIKCLEVDEMDYIQTAQMQSKELSVLLKRNQNKKLQDLGVNSYQKAYLGRRNNIMFIFTYVTPHISNLFELVNHDIYLFIIAKKAYHDMIEFNKQIEGKQDFLKLNSFFKQFAASTGYREIAIKIKRDQEVIRDQVKHYGASINKSSNSALGQELDFNQIKNVNWLQFVQQTLNRYQCQLGNRLDAIYQDTIKKDAISVIWALKYYREHLKNAETEEFAHELASLDYEEAEKYIKKRLSGQDDQ